MRLNIVSGVNCPMRQGKLVPIKTCRESAFYGNVKDIKRCRYFVREWVAGYFQNTTEIECCYKK